MRSELDKGSAQFDYFSRNYEKFEDDFYEVADTTVPLAFLNDDILKMMVATGIDFFKLSGDYTSDGRDYYFLFERSAQNDNPQVTNFKYLRRAKGQKPAGEGLQVAK
ncbi:DUF5960 family protein [Propionimicrobium lymphophilum]|uniref:DUF5960 family protein n=1 Tax=Propionimicrobium lymphophilum TaxID=33012 RepID=UPI00288A4A85|nr:DUF5960 family protein [Propionimicrobium lymphophilum]